MILDRAGRQQRNLTKMLRVLQNVYTNLKMAVKMIDEFGVHKASVHYILTVSLKVKKVWAKTVRCIASRCGNGEAILREERGPFD
jgi:hypothetical protein